METYRSLLPPRTVHRLFNLLVFASLVVLFRHLLVLLVFFVAFERPLDLGSRYLARVTGMGRRAAVAALALGLLAAIGTALGLGIGRAVHAALHLRGALPDHIAAFRDSELYRRIEEYLPAAGSAVETAQHYASDALRYLAEVGHFLLYILIGYILAVIHLLEAEELENFRRSVDPHRLPGTLLRWLAYLGDATSVTLQFQLIVAACNAILTFPVLLLVGIPHAPAMLFMVFFSGLVPVAGNFVAGATLTLLAHQARGWMGVGIFVGLTFVLHKLESYYLNPRLAARHVHLPGFVLIISLILWEHLFGFVGLFLSFPFLYVASRIRDEFLVDDQAEKAAADKNENADDTKPSLKAIE